MSRRGTADLHSPAAPRRQKGDATMLKTLDYIAALVVASAVIVPTVSQAAERQSGSRILCRPEPRDSSSGQNKRQRRIAYAAQLVCDIGLSARSQLPCELSRDCRDGDDRRRASPHSRRPSQARAIRAWRSSALRAIIVAAHVMFKFRTSRRASIPRMRGGLSQRPAMPGPGRNRAGRPAARCRRRAGRSSGPTGCA